MTRTLTSTTPNADAAELQSAYAIERATWREVNDFPTRVAFWTADRLAQLRTMAKVRWPDPDAVANGLATFFGATPRAIRWIADRHSIRLGSKPTRRPSRSRNHDA